jgi:hypothetical protein
LSNVAYWFRCEAAVMSSTPDAMQALCQSEWTQT